MERTRPSRRQVIFLIAGITVVFVAGLIGSALTPTLATRHPLLLITLDARYRMLVLARRVDTVPFFVVGVLRRLSSDPLYWLLGYWYGDRAIRWLQRNAGMGDLVVWTERFFAKAAYPMVFLFPGAVVCALAGAAGMRFGAFLAVNATGTIVVVTAVRLSSGLLASPVDAVLGFFREYLVETTVASIVLTALSIVLSRARGVSEVPSVDELESDEEQQAAQPEEGAS